MPCHSAEVALTSGNPDVVEGAALLEPAEPWPASSHGLQAGTVGLTAAADTTADAVADPSQSDDAPSAVRTLQECSSAMAASSQPELPVAFDERYKVFTGQKQQPHVMSLNAQGTVDQTQPSSSDTAGLHATKQVIVDSALLNTLTRAGFQPSIAPTAALSAGMQPMPQAGADQLAMRHESDINLDYSIHPQAGLYAAHNVWPTTGPYADSDDDPTRDTQIDLDAAIAAGVPAISAETSQPHAATTPQVAVYEGDKDFGAALAAELAAMMTLAESAHTAQASESVPQRSDLEDGSTRISRLDNPTSPLVEPTAVACMALSTDSSIPAGDVGPGPATMCSAAWPEQEQELASSQAQDKDPSESKSLLAVAAASPQEACGPVYVEAALDASIWHALLADASAHPTTQLQFTLVDKGTASLNSSWVGSDSRA